MSILSTSSRLIKVGQEYSAGSGISIDNHIISVTSIPGTTYSAGENITIEDNIINSKDWSQDIADASANAYNAATAQIPAPFDPSYISGQIDNKLDSTAFTAWQSGQYATDLQTIEGQINNKLDTSSFSEVSASFLTAINIPESATWNEVSQVYEQASGTYLTSISIPESATWQDVSTTVQTNSAQWADGGTGDEEVNSFVYDNSATINDVNSSYQENSGSWNNKLDTSSFSSVSGNFITALPEDLVYTNDLTGYLSTSSTGSFRTKASISVDSSGMGPLGFPSEYTFLTQNKLVFTSADFPPTQVQVDADSVNNWNSNYNTVTSNSSNWNDITVYQTNSSTYLTSHQDLSDYAKSSALSDYQTIDGMTAYQLVGDYATESFVENVSGEITALIPDTSNFITNSSAESTYQTIAGMTAYQPIGSYATTNDLEQFSGDITTLIPSTAGLASESYVQTNSAVLTGMIDAKQDTLTFGYDGQDKISAINNSAIAGGAAFDVFPISGTGAVDVYEQNSVLWVSGKDFTSDISYISGTIGDVETLLASL